MNKSSSLKVDQLERTENYVVSVWRRVMLLVWCDKASAMGIERSRTLFDEWVKDHPRGAVFLIVVPPLRTRAPDPETLEAMRQAANYPDPRCKGMATLLEAEGFVAASVRSIMMRLHAVSVREDPANVFGSTAKAAAWAAAQLEDPEISSASLAEAIRLVRES